ncbi:MAG: DEAD/DEAH box helicase family protein [Candidatus Sphingomonas phytovorans]|nr:DEAD/DEAH box helicase family protein [Sphingomonas sp.]WEJ99484.1 MAG: DEAD/DEAH box helicase family protein [Sphingomonas sp.]
MKSENAQPPNLKRLPTPLLLETSTDNIIRSFFEPALRASTSYDRGVGYFTSGWLRLASAGLDGFAENGGKARFLVSPHLSEDDWIAIRDGSEAKNDAILRDALLSVVEELKSLGDDPAVAMLAALVATGTLEFKIAMPVGALDGDFHDKFGVFRDDLGNAIAFHGSQNDSEKAYRNFEAISLYYSWLGRIESQRVNSHKERFDRLWNNLDENLRSIAVPEVVINELKLIHRRRQERNGPGHQVVDDARWQHQTQAVDAFCAAGAGVLEMATGTGKTRTALKILDRLLHERRVTSCVVTMSGTDLLDQWYEELAARDDLVIHRSYGGHHEELSFLNDPAGAVLLASRQALPAIVTRMPRTLPANALLICDEVHGMGSASMVRELSGELVRFRYRLGLSATPEREYDAEGTDFVEREIGPVVFRFGLEEAIRKGILCGFDYIELGYEFSDEDKVAVRAAIAAYHARRKAGRDPGIESMYREIAAVGKTTRSKLPAFTDFIRRRPEVLKRAVLFVETSDFGLDVQHIILPIARNYHTYYAEDDRRNLVRFASGELETVITCHRISEGIDIRSVNAIILFASSRARLETVQRLGRCLRKDPSNPSKRALVVDFIRHDDISDEPDSLPTSDQARSAWLRKLARIGADN